MEASQPHSAYMNVTPLNIRGLEKEVYYKALGII